MSVISSLVAEEEDVSINARMKEPALLLPQ